MAPSDFKKEIRRYYRKNGRDFQWRRTTDPYRIVVSEIMLQQTQTARVEPKYRAFVREFPSFKALAKAPVSKVLAAWHGLGYNRRALYLKKLAEIVTGEYQGKLPEAPAELIKLPGIGKNTAGSVLAFAFNKPVPFIETNIRRVFIFFFFPKKKKIQDDKILELVTATLDTKNPREWYYALMDYGAMLTKATENPNRRSGHYAVQSKFEGSRRQTRGLVLKLLLNRPNRLSELVRASGKDRELMAAILSDLSREGFITREGDYWRLRT